ncbi:MAG TPA: class I SAM-dependent methyltransferase [Candidatus Acidoferrum sp.]|nr:class I SAM-dependent methyltransferase [Candidatus Acidoferrum sp.]
MTSVPNDRGALQAQVRESYATAEALAVYRKRVDQGLRIWEATVVREQFPARGRVLAIGCGAGREAFALERLGYDTHGVDISRPLLGIAAEMRDQRGQRTSFCLIDGETMPFDRAAFDVVTLWAQMLDNVPSRAGRLALMREVRRVLVPGGPATFSAHDDERTRPEIDSADVVLADVPEQGDLVLHERREAATRYCHLFRRDELVDLVQEAGLTDARIRHTSDLGEAWGNVFVVTCRR